MNSYDEIRDLYKGEACIVIGNGPSLSDIPIDFLKNRRTFGTNRIYLLKDFQPNFYVVVNPLVISQFSSEIENVDCDIKFIGADQHRNFSGAFEIRSQNSSCFPTFSTNPKNGLYEGYTVTFVCLQLAYWMGFSTALLVGVDHNYKFDGNPNQAKVSRGDDVNHFHKGYFGKGVKWHNPDLEESEKSYKMAKEAFEADGRKIINLTTKTNLDVFEKGDWRKW